MNIQHIANPEGSPPLAGIEDIDMDDMLLIDTYIATDPEAEFMINKLNTNFDSALGIYLRSAFGTVNEAITKAQEASK